MTRMVWPTATAAFALPRLAANRRYWAAREVPFARAAACAAWTRSARRQGLPLRVLPLRRIAQGAPGALVVAGAHPGPRGQVVGRREAGELGADLGHERFGDGAADAGDRVQAGDRLLDRPQALGDLGAHAGDALIEEVDVGQLLGD